MRPAAGAARRPRCCTSWLTRCPSPAASAPTWTRPLSCASPSATCACTASAPQGSGTRWEQGENHWMPAT
ncbi:HIF3A isoform 17 [Pan troglodytes]|uniref:Hypoxia inducible factor 3 subunit alpha n=2 Tax=Homininae TaxID=207598 RepID=E9PJR0_HUMAN|nr:hypoxia inducible factor 3 subunit alpha [Homo sapiens]PNI28816.1 HIF3A isoform 10 [Pan troglodytes]KAI2591852.1 hypoxia inducible factor 3 subunit alpha [Homo sapiens]KAI2591853.1 hypoxia inducible factor 3 subunit alpha [Homo sapiens]KAI4043506.1 hypoxia inducible factor 3 subunit alpha [Homo sapiens]